MRHFSCVHLNSSRVPTCGFFISLKSKYSVVADIHCYLHSIYIYRKLWLDMPYYWFLLVWSKCTVNQYLGSHKQLKQFLFGHSLGRLLVGWDENTNLRLKTSLRLLLEGLEGLESERCPTRYPVFDCASYNGQEVPRSEHSGAGGADGSQTQTGTGFCWDSSHLGATVLHQR